MIIYISWLLGFMAFQLDILTRTASILWPSMLRFFFKPTHLPNNTTTHAQEPRNKQRNKLLGQGETRWHIRHAFNWKNKIMKYNMTLRHCRYAWDGLNNLTYAREVLEKFTILHVRLERGAVWHQHTKLQIWRRKKCFWNLQKWERKNFHPLMSVAFHIWPPRLASNKAGQ